MPRLIVLCLCIYCSTLIQAQQVDPLKERSFSTHLYLIGNYYSSKPTDSLYRRIENLIEDKTARPFIILLGDIVGKQGLTSSLSEQQDQQLEQLVRWNEKAGLYVLSGDRDWDRSGKKGLQKVRRLEKEIEKKRKLKKAFIPSKGCPGPKVVELTEDLVLIAVNSQWFIHPHDRPEAPDTDCKILSDGDFWDELEEAIDEAEGKNIVIAAHHPVYSYGQYAGKRLGHFHFLPVLGTIYASYRQQIGRSADLANHRYQLYAHHMQNLLAKYSSIVYASGHEYDLQAIQKEDNYYINSGAFGESRAVGKGKDLIFRQSSQGLLRLEYASNGAIRLQPFEYQNNILQKKSPLPLYQSYCEEVTKDLPINSAFIPCEKKSFPFFTNKQFSLPDTAGIIAAGPEYVDTRFRKWAMGEHYRKEWKTTIHAPYIDLRKEKSGLVPFAKGGGLQTHSLKFKNPEGKEYAFRAVDKDPVKALDDLARQTIYRHIVKDLITTQHPYGGIVASHLMDATDILHAEPQLFLMPDDPGLGIYRKDFAGLLGTLEFRPKKVKKGKKGFGGADLIHSSPKMFRAMYKDHDYRIDRQSYARARIFDLLVGDWDRHEDNWKWAGFKDGKTVHYRPIPRDRDHVFSQWEGLIPSIGDKVIPNAEHFGLNFGNASHLSFKARHLDRQLANELSRKDWQEAAHYIENQISHATIDSSLAKLPKEVQVFSAEEIGNKLKSRKEQLETAASDLYLLLAKEVDVVGSNKREIFVVRRNANGSLLVQMYDRDKAGERGKLLYNRLFYSTETKEIRLFGLGGADEFYVEGGGAAGPLLRIIGGRGADIIEDRSKINKSVHYTQIYDSREEDQILTGPGTKVKRPAHEARYNNKAFEYNALSPIPKFRISSGNGFGLELQVTHLSRGFNKPDFKNKFQAKAIYYPGIKAHRLDLRNWFRHAIGLHDIRLHLRVSSLYDKFPFFYGIGNLSVRDEELVEDDFYRTDYNTIIFNAALERQFFSKSEYQIGLQYEYNNILPANEDASIFDLPEFANLNGRGIQHLTGLTAQVDFDFRDNPNFSRYGSQVFIYNELFSNHNQSGDLFGKVEGYFAHYNTIQVGRPLTFAFRGGFSQSYGPSPFNHLSALGSNAYLRAYVRNRFLGKTAVYLNSELRLLNGTIRTPLLPVNWGMFGFFDIGRVWSDRIENRDILHRGFGGGLFASPLNENFNFVFTFGQSREREFYFSINIGFSLQ